MQSSKRNLVLILLVVALSFIMGNTMADNAHPFAPYRDFQVESVRDMFEDYLTDSYFEVLEETEVYNNFMQNPSDESYDSLIDFVKYEAYTHALRGEDIVNPSSRGAFEGLFANYNW